METPALLPKELNYTTVAVDDRNLLNMAVKIPHDFFIFFEYATEDETWSENHLEFMKGAIAWFTNQFFHDKLLMEKAIKIAGYICKHHLILSRVVPHNLAFDIKGEKFTFNSLLWGAASEFLRQFIRDQFRDKNRKMFELLGVDRSVFIEINEFINTGVVSQLWKKTPEEVAQVLKQADEWGLTSLSQIAQDILKRYITQESVVDDLLKAHFNGWSLLKEACIDFINGQGAGVHFEKGDIGELFFEFKNFRRDANSIFEAVREEITHLIVSRKLTDQKEFSDIINRLPKLASLSLSGSLNFSERLMDIPESLQELKVDKCPWINNKTLKQIIEICPNLSSLSLASNVQLKYSDWTLLSKLNNLEKLDITSCRQISDQDFNIVLAACRQITHLRIGSCDNLSDAAFLAIGKYLPKLSDLDLSRLNISDPALIDLTINCKNLYSLDLTRCKNITDKGVLESVRNASALKNINLTKCPVSTLTISKIREIKPFLHVII